ncbi:MAG: CAP domain-containing protein [Saprospiraceae bacterium]
MKTLLALLVCTAATLTWWPAPQLKTHHEARPDPSAAEAVLDAVNNLRAAGCKCPDGKRYRPAPPLRLDERLGKAAQAHADDMFLRKYFSHRGRDGSETSDRVERTGYRWVTVGENIAKGYPTAEAVVQAWRTSADHCSNLMEPGFRDMGLGKKGPYWVQNFGATER